MLSNQIDRVLFTGTLFIETRSVIDELFPKKKLYSKKTGIIASFKQINPSRPNTARREKIDLNFYFHTSLWCIKGFIKPQTSVKLKIQVNFHFNTTF